MNKESKRNAGQLILSHSTRGQLISSLNELSTILLSGKPVPKIAKERICKKIDESILLLAELTPFKRTQSTDVSRVFEDSVSGQLIVELSKAERLKVTGHLMAVREAVQFDNLTGAEAKRSLAAENKRIVNQLMNLLDEEQSDYEDLLLERMGNFGISSQNDELDKLKAAVESQKWQMSNLVARFERQMSELKSGLKRKIEKTDINQAGASFKFELSSVSGFFGTYDSVEYGDRFWCKGMQWSIYVKHNLKEDGSKHMGLFIRCHNDDYQQWSCQAKASLILYSNSFKNQNKIWPIDHTFQSSQPTGASYLISYRELKSGNYIKNDKIVVGVELNAGSVIRLF